MLSAIYNGGIIFIAVLFSAASIKLADDFLDKDSDKIAGHFNWAEKLGNGTMFYSILFLIVAAGISTTLSLSLFMSSYIVGMFNQLKLKFLSGLTGLQESILVLVAGLLICGWNMMLFSFLFILAVQLVDDSLDVYADKLAGFQNTAIRFGTVECLLTAAMSLLIACWLNEIVFIPTFCATVCFYLLLFWLQTKER